MRPALEWGSWSQYHSTEENCFVFLSQKLLFGFLARVELCTHSPCSVLGLCLVLACAGLVHAVSSYVYLSYCVWKMTIPCHCHHLCPLLHIDSLSPEGRDMANIPFRAEPSEVSRPLHSDLKSLVLCTLTRCVFLYRLLFSSGSFFDEGERATALYVIGSHFNAMLS